MHDAPAEGLADGLVAETHAQQRNPSGELLDGGH